ncbi:hypothetical protein [Rhizobium leguminosarum]
MTKPKKLPSDEVLRLLVAEGLTRAQILQRYEVHRTTLGNKLIALGLAEAVARVPGERREFTVEAVSQHLKSGMSYSDIDRHYDRSIGSAWCFCRSRGLIPEIPDTEIREDKVIVGITTTATDKSGSARTVRMAISLPPVSMHVAERLQPSEAMGAR